MKLQRNFARIATVGLMAFVLTGCATHYDRKSNNTLLGAGLGAATGAVFSGGDPLYTLGGAAAGGVLGNVLTEDRSSRRSSNWDRGRDYRPSRSHTRNRDDRRSHDRHDRRRR
ncbi:MAG TPA: hypothetical protein VIP51_16880 [Eoetvoesiella sp.]